LLKQDRKRVTVGLVYALSCKECPELLALQTLSGLFLDGGAAGPMGSANDCTLDGVGAARRTSLGAVGSAEAGFHG